MWKGIGRFGVILLVVVVIGAGIYALVEANAGRLALAGGAGEERVRPAGDEAAFQRGATPEAPAGSVRPGGVRPGGVRPGGVPPEGGRGGGMAWFGILKNVGVMAAITAVVAGVQKMLQVVSRRRAVRAA